MNGYLKIALEAALAGGEVLNSYFGKIETVEIKDAHSDLVTQADKDSEASIIDLLSLHYPDHAIIAEESRASEKRGKEYVWVIDPLDGTTNYTHQYPFFAVSIGLLHNDWPVVGVVYNPYTRELFYASKGEGAFLNHVRIRVSNTSALNQSLLATGFPYDRYKNNENNYQEFCHLTQISQGVRRDGAAALDLAYVASGRLDGFWECGLKIWDIAAGIVLVEEAGGEISDYSGGALNLDNGFILASNGKIHGDLRREINSME